MYLELEQTTRLQPGRVLRVAGTRVQLRCGGETVWARMALAYPYQAAVGDQLLAIGQEEDWYVIGVLQGSGTTTLTVTGDLRIDAPRGSIELNAAQGLHIRGTTVLVATHDRDLIARMGKRVIALDAGRLATA